MDALIDMIKHKEYDPSKVNEQYGTGLGELINWMLNKDPGKRPKMEDLMKEKLIVDNLWLGFKYLLKCKTIFS